MSITSPRSAPARRSSSESRPRACFTRCGALGWRRTLSTTALLSALTYSAAAAPAIRASNESRPCDCCRRCGAILEVRASSGATFEEHATREAAIKASTGSRPRNCQHFAISACEKGLQITERHSALAERLGACEKDKQWQRELGCLAAARPSAAAGRISSGKLPCTRCRRLSRSNSSAMTRKAVLEPNASSYNSVRRRTL